MWMKNMVMCALFWNMLLLPGNLRNPKQVYLEYKCKEIDFTNQAAKVDKLNAQRRKELLNKIEDEISDFNRYFVSLKDYYDTADLNAIKTNLSSSLQALKNAIAKEQANTATGSAHPEVTGVTVPGEQEGAGAPQPSEEEAYEALLGYNSQSGNN